MTDTEISSDGVQQKYFTQIPNMALYDLSASAYKLLAVYLDMTDIGIVQAQSKTILSRLGMSTNAMKKARQELADCGYIQYTKGIQGKGKKTTLAKVSININWMWTENLKRKGKPSEIDTPKRVSKNDTPLSKTDNIEQEPIKQELKILSVEKAPQVKNDNPKKRNISKTKKRDRIFDGVAHICFGLETLSDRREAGARIGKIVKWIKELEEKVEPSELWSWSKWYDLQNDGAARPRDVGKFAEHFLLYRQSESSRKVKQSATKQAATLNSNMMAELEGIG